MLGNVKGRDGEVAGSVGPAEPDEGRGVVEGEHGAVGSHLQGFCAASAGHMDNFIPRGRRSAQDGRCGRGIGVIGLVRIACGIIHALHLLLFCLYRTAVFVLRTARKLPAFCPAHKNESADD